MDFFNGLLAYKRGKEVNLNLEKRGGYGSRKINWWGSLTLPGGEI